MTARLAYRFAGGTGVELIACGRCAPTVRDEPEGDPIPPDAVDEAAPDESCHVCGRLLGSRPERWRARWYAERLRIGDIDYYSAGASLLSWRTACAERIGCGMRRYYRARGAML